MKLVIATQYMENYGAHDWDGKGICPQYWKDKGGITYVVENLSAEQVKRAVSTDIPTLRSLICYSNEYSEEYLLDVYGAADTDPVVEPWQTPVLLSFEDGKWKACEVIKNEEYGYLRKEIALVTKRWDMLPNGQCENYKALFTLRDGRTVPAEKISEALAA